MWRACGLRQLHTASWGAGLGLGPWFWGEQLPNRAALEPRPQRASCRLLCGWLRGQACLRGQDPRVTQACICLLYLWSSILVILVQNPSSLEILGTCLVSSYEELCWEW